MTRPASHTLPIFIVGAGRSGTTFFTDALCSKPNLVDVKENRYIWNYRQKDLGADRRDASEATQDTGTFIRNFYDEIAHRTGKRPVDKTPSNVFRLPFLHAIYPEARIIHLIRDGRDNVISRRRQWIAGDARPTDRRARQPEIRRWYYLRHQLDVTFRLIRRRNLPANRWGAFLRDNAGIFLKSLATQQSARYGERYPGMQAVLDTYGLTVAAAVQWRESVMAAACDGRCLPPACYLEVRYESLIENPAYEWRRIADFLDIDRDSQAGRALIERANPSSIGKWREHLSDDDLALLEPHIRPTLEYMGYSWRP